MAGVKDIDQYKSASSPKNLLNGHLSIKKALFVEKEKRGQKSSWMLLEFGSKLKLKSSHLKLWITKQLKIKTECLKSEQNSESQN